MLIKKIYIISIILFILSPNIVFAQNIKNENNSPLTVEADDSLEWFEKEKYYLAKGNVILKKNGLTLKANIVKANYVIVNNENTFMFLNLKKLILSSFNIGGNGILFFLSDFIIFSFSLMQLSKAVL